MARPKRPLKIPVARCKDLNCMVSIDSVTPATCSLTHLCPKCDGRVIPILPRTRRRHFRHKQATNCAFGSGQTALHLYAVALFKHLDSIWVPEGPAAQPSRHLKIHTSCTELWDRGRRFDVMLSTNEGALVVEVKVTHRVDETKARELADRKLHCLEIDLARHNLDDDVRAAIRETAPRHWVTTVGFDELGGESYETKIVTLLTRANAWIAANPLSRAQMIDRQWLDLRLARAALFKARFTCQEVLQTVRQSRPMIEQPWDSRSHQRSIEHTRALVELGLSYGRPGFRKRWHAFKA